MSWRARRTEAISRLATAESAVIATEYPPLGSSEQKLEFVLPFFLKTISLRPSPHRWLSVEAPSDVSTVDNPLPTLPVSTKRDTVMNSRCVPPLPLNEDAATSRLPGALGWILYRFGLIGGGILWVATASTLCGCTQTNGWVMNQSGRAYYNRGNYTAARYEFERALMDSPYNASYAYNVARAMEKQGDIAGAEQMYQHAIQLDPSHQPTYHAMSTMLASQGRESEAHELLQAWATTQPYASGSQAELAQFEGSTGMAASGPMGGMMSAAATQQSMNMNGLAAIPPQMPMDPHAHAASMSIDSQGSFTAMSNPYQQVSMSRTQPGTGTGDSPALQMASSMPQSDPSFAGGPMARVYSQPQMAGMQPQMAGMQPQMAGMQPQMAGMQPQMAGIQSQPWGTSVTPITQAASAVPASASSPALVAAPQQVSAGMAGPVLRAPGPVVPGQPVELGQPQPVTQVVPNTSYPMMSNVPMIQAF
jgi:tetratricopeptide (TPR) repeat protein